MLYHLHPCLSGRAVLVWFLGWDRSLPASVCGGRQRRHHPPSPGPCPYNTHFPLTTLSRKLADHEYVFLTLTRDFNKITKEVNHKQKV